MGHTKSDRNSGVKPEGIASKIVVPESHETKTSDASVEFANLKEALSLETERADSRAARMET